jgi:hypothetical protein
MRPTAPQIVERLVGSLIRATTTSSVTDWDDNFTSKFRRSVQAQPLLPSVTQIEYMLFGDGEFKFSSLSISSDSSIQRPSKVVFFRFSIKIKMIGSRPACPECFPDRESSDGPENRTGARKYNADVINGSLLLPTGQRKRRYEAASESSDSEPDLEQPRAKKSKPSHE